MVRPCQEGSKRGSQKRTFCYRKLLFFSGDECIIFSANRISILQNSLRCGMVRTVMNISGEIPLDANGLPVMKTLQDMMHVFVANAKDGKACFHAAPEGSTKPLCWERSIFLSGSPQLFDGRVEYLQKEEQITETSELPRGVAGCEIGCMGRTCFEGILEQYRKR